MGAYVAKSTLGTVFARLTQSPQSGRDAPSQSHAEGARTRAGFAWDAGA